MAILPTLPQKLRAAWNALTLRADMLSDLRHPTAWLVSWALGGRTHAGIDVSPAAAMTLPAYYAALRCISEDVGKLPLITYERLEPRGKRRATEHSLYDLLHDAPNEFMSAMTWRETLTHHCLAWGNGYSEIVRQTGDVVALGRPIHPSRVTPQFSEQGELVYEVHTGDLYTHRVPPDRPLTYTLPQRDMIHLRGLGDGIVGYSVAQMAAESLGLSLAAQQFGAQFFGNGTHTGGIFTHPNTLSDTAQQHLRESLDRYRIGGDDAMKVLLLEEGMKYETATIPPEDAQFLECTAPETLFTMADGTRCRADRLTVGMQVMAWNPDLQEMTAGVLRALATKAPQPLLRILTERGRSLTTTADHPYWAAKRQRTAGGRYRHATLDACVQWHTAGALEPGDYVRVALSPQIDGTKELDFHAAWMIGALVGDGYIRQGAISFTSNVEAVTQGMRQALAHYGASLKAVSGKDYFILTGGRGRQSSPFRRLMKSTGLIGTHSHTKFVPESIFRSGEDAWKGFLSGYLDTDGTVWGTKKKQPAVWWGSTSQQLMQDCQHVLALLGVQSSVYGGRSGYRHVHGFPNGKPCWQLYVTGQSQVKRLAELLSPLHPEKQARLTAFRQPFKEYHANFFTYDRIDSIEYLPDGPTIGVEISPHHTHVTNGIITHNTRQFQVVEVARWFRLPPHKIQELTHATFSNIEHQGLEYVVDTLQPWLVRWEQELKRKLFLDDPDFFAEHQVLGLLRGDQQARSNYYRTLFYIGAVSPNDIRELENQNPIVDADGDLDPAGEMYYIQNNLATLQTIAKQTTVPPRGGGFPSNPGPAPDEPADEQDGAEENEEEEEEQASRVAHLHTNGVRKRSWEED